MFADNHDSRVFTVVFFAVVFFGMEQFHCSICDDYDLCAPCMRTSGKGGRGGWGRVQADEGLAQRVLTRRRKAPPV